MIEIPTWATDEFFQETANEIKRVGFLSNEHIFTPYRDTICAHAELISERMEQLDNDIGPLKPGSIKSPYGRIFFLFDSHRIKDEEVTNVILNWIENEYKFDDDDAEDNDISPRVGPLAT